jgi:type III pantothenate kinase
MRPHVVVDVGNSRVKWGVCAADGSGILQVLSLADDADVWQRELRKQVAQPPLALAQGPLNWVLASVRPERSSRLAAWLRQQGQRVALLERAAQLPLAVPLTHPDYVGIDRLLNAVAAKRRLPAGRPAVLIDAGSAVTVDWLDEAHAFRGGAIFPGVRLMAKALNDYTALLPLVSIPEPVPPLPAGDTISAMQAGIFHAVAGAIERIVRRLAEQAVAAPEVFLTGGDAGLLHGALAGAGRPVLWPTQTLEGILHSAEALVP